MTDSSTTDDAQPAPVVDALTDADRAALAEWPSLTPDDLVFDLNALITMYGNVRAQIVAISHSMDIEKWRRLTRRAAALRALAVRRYGAPPTTPADTCPGLPLGAASEVPRCGLFAAHGPHPLGSAQPLLGHEPPMVISIGNAEHHESVGVQLQRHGRRQIALAELADLRALIEYETDSAWARKLDELVTWFDASHEAAGGDPWDPGMLPGLRKAVEDTIQRRAAAQLAALDRAVRMLGGA